MRNTGISMILMCTGMQAAVAGGDLEAPTQFVATLAANAIWEQAGSEQTLTLAPGLDQTYVPHRESHMLAGAELFAGAERTVTPHVLGQLGLAVATTSYANLEGVILDDGDPAFDNFLYHYKLRHAQVALKTKLLMPTERRVMPWVSGSVGVAYNQARGYSNTPTIFEAIQMSNFGNHSTAAFTYSVGAGVETQSDRNWHAGLGYEFSDWGRSHLNPATNRVSGGGLLLAHFYTHSLIAYLTYKK